MDRCIVCGSYNVYEVVEDKIFKYKGHSCIIEKHRSIKCRRCDNAVDDGETYFRSIPILREFHKRINNLNRG